MKKTISSDRAINSLAEIKASFGGDFPVQKLRLLKTIASSRISSARSLLSYHESLCYMRAYPDNPGVLLFVQRELEYFENRVRSLTRKERTKLNETGIVGTELNHPYAYFMTRWILAKFPGAANLDWKEMEKSDNDHVLDLFPVLLSHCENDAVDDPYLPTLDIIDADIDSRDVNKLEWFMKLFERLPAKTPLKRLIFDKLDLPIVIDISNRPFARTNVTMSAGKTYYQQEPLQKQYPDLRKVVRKEELKPKLLSRRAALEVVDTHKMAMIMRHRELWPLTFSNLDELYATDIGRGMTIYIMGMQPEWRLPIESNYAALLVRNGIPIGYGIGAMAFERIEIAINIFETFRRSEAGYIFGKFAQLYHQLFGCQYLMIRRYQVGYNNAEGLDSGAYWFYYKLGFRSIDDDVRALAEREAKRIAKEKEYRSSRATLKQLAESDMCLDFQRPGRFTNQDVALGQVALAETRVISSMFDGDRDRAEKEAPILVRRLLSAGSIARWSRDEKMWFDRLSLFALAIPGLAKWSASEKSDLVELMRAKGSVREQRYTQLLRKHKKLLHAVRLLSK